MGLFDFFKRHKREEPEEIEYSPEEHWEAEEPEEPEEPAYIPPSVPLFEEPVRKPEGWPVMEPVGISEKVMQFMQEHTPEETVFAAENAAKEGIKAFQAENYERAREFFQLGSELGDQKAQALLGSMYIQGYEVPRDLAVGRAWLRRSAEQGNAQAAEILARYVGESEPIADELYESAQEALETNRKTGLYYLGRAADMGHSQAQYEYGMTLIHDDDDEPKGIEWIKRSAFGGYSRAMTYLGNAYLKGEVVPQSNSIALEWFEQAVKKNDPEAQLLLGSLYARGTGVPQNTATALRLLTLAADAGLSEARDRIQELLSPESVPAEKKEPAVLQPVEELLPQSEPEEPAPSEEPAPKVLSVAPDVSLDEFSQLSFEPMEGVFDDLKKAEPSLEEEQPKETEQAPVVPETEPVLPEEKPEEAGTAAEPAAEAAESAPAESAAETLPPADKVAPAEIFKPNDIAEVFKQAEDLSETRKMPKLSDLKAALEQRKE